MVRHRSHETYLVTWLVVSFFMFFIFNRLHGESETALLVSFVFEVTQNIVENMVLR